jgi:hypothetical protein
VKKSSSGIPVRFFVGGIQNLVGDSQPLDWNVSQNVRLNNFVNVLWPHPTVKNPFWIHRNGRAQLALIETPRLIRAHQLYAALRQLGLEQSLQLALPGRIAASARMALFPLIHANENMFSEFRH